jgi:Transmembrane protein 43
MCAPGRLAGDFKQQDGHVNPELRYRAGTFPARDVTFGAFKPGEAVVKELPANQPVRVDQAMAQALRGRVTGPVSAVDGAFYLGADATQPRIGDLRISYTVTPAGPVSIVGRQSGVDFAPYQTQAGDRLLMVKPGMISAADMFKEAKREAAILTWVLRFIGALVMFIGFALVLNPLVVVADVVPFIGNVLGAGASLVSLILTAILAPLVIAIAWLWYRPLVSIIVILVGLALAYGFKRWAASKVATKAAAASAQPAPAG